MEVAWSGALRHGLSAGNVAAELAEAPGADVIAIDTPDHATGLTEAGQPQAVAIGEWFLQQPASGRPEASTYRPYFVDQERRDGLAELLRLLREGEVARCR